MTLSSNVTGEALNDVKLSDVKICSGMAVSFENQHTFHFSGGVKLSDIKICSLTAVSFDSHHNLSFFWCELE
jgi:hypothetical protein